MRQGIRIKEWAGGTLPEGWEVAGFEVIDGKRVVIIAEQQKHDILTALCGTHGRVVK
jgi:hypothetical protein